MSRPRVHAPAGGERGFVLIGVVVMVLALTIIGISLYALSGYESQFFGRSYAERQAIYRASSGIEIVKKLVTTPLGSPAGYRLANAGLAVGRENVVSAVAWQENPIDSTGPIVWNKNVFIRVGVNLWGATRIVEGQYRPAQPNNPYWRLFSSTYGISYSGTPGTLRARGGAWQTVQSSADTAWIRQLESASSVAVSALPTTSPLVASFVAAHYPGPASADTATRSWDFSNPSNPAGSTFTTISLTMDAGAAPNAYRFFRSGSDVWTPAQSMLPFFDFFSGANITVWVRGTAVWIVPAGFYTLGEFRVQKLPGATTANLVLVTGRSVRYLQPTLGAWLPKAVYTPNDDANVFIVSDGTVVAQDATLITSPSVLTCHNLCIYANAIQLSGPATSTHVLSYTYRPDFQQVADDLYARGLLPAASGVQTSTFTFIPGSWRESPALQ